ncbi:hypothetical protein Nepgr_007645 [Nepenthes gracilis]|uniref:Uncharacterized protein n=1 Tax=Nepenthes gracilis TaxID=150966 RepID=A0AAD3XIM7_NEPGR|nr:hypothetical protein Nepgr_007645 [Nepenthes gracilis]
MEIPEKLLKFRFHFLFGVGLSLSIVYLVKLAPSFLDILAYFWPLLLSTALFLAAVVAFGRITPPAADVPGENSAEGLLDFVTAQPDPTSEIDNNKAE